MPPETRDHTLLRLTCEEREHKLYVQVMVCKR